MIAYLGLGSNIGDKEGYLRSAVEAMDAVVGIRILECSRLYRTSPQGIEDQDWFLNAAVRIETDLEPPDLLKALKSLERQLGRIRRERWGPREIDIDLLFYHNRIIQTPDLVLPHPEWDQRAFVLHPLMDLESGGIFNREGLTPGQCLERIEKDQGERQRVELHPAAALSCRFGRWIDVRTDGPEATESLGERLGRVCRGGEVIALCGPLGSGKTCLARGLARGMGVSQPIQSPTFTLCRDYVGERLSLYHWDFYRLSDSGDTESAGFEDALSDESGVVVVEWAEKFPDLWTYPIIRICLRVVDDESRDAAVRFPIGASSSESDASPVRFPLLYAALEGWIADHPASRIHTTKSPLNPCSSPEKGSTQ